MQTAVVVGLITLLVVGASGVGAQQQNDIRVDGEPDFEAYLPENTVTPGEETEITVQLDNSGQLENGQETNRELVTTARNVVVRVDDDDTPITVTTGRQSVGTVTEDEPREATFDVEVPNDAEPGNYQLEVDIDYRYTESVRQTEAITSQDQKSTSETETITVEVSDDARFRVRNVSSTLRVGEEGEITGEIVNVGENDATNAEVEFPTEDENVFPMERSVAVGDVPAGETAEFRIPVEIGSEAEAVPKRFDLPVSFRDQNGIRTTDDSPELLADIGSERDAFSIEPVNGSVAAGSSGVMEFTVTNNRDETLTNIEPKLFTDSPFSSSNDEAFIESLDPGESTTVSFDLSTASSATPKTYPVTLDVRYDDAEGTSHITDSYRVAIGVTPAEEGGGGLLRTVVIGFVSMFAVGGGYVWYRDQ